ncbi:MAG: nuclear transport factor 2 family protein [Niveispirillum sp.]|uniref:nuclear transport factor 2 family protein n=1 Tax=Niveispirillum sp. TaxID=1917217 RepID=UPI0009EC2F07
MNIKNIAIVSTLIAPLLFAAPMAAAQSALVDSRPVKTGSETEKAIIGVVEDYFWGRQNGDQERLQRGFLDTGDLKGIRQQDGQDVLNIEPLSAFRGRLAKPMTMDTKGEILALDIVDDKLAWVKLTLDSKVNTYTDYLMMYKINGQWKLVNKMFTNKRK